MVMSQSIQSKVLLVTLQQKTCYDTILKAVNLGNGLIFLLVAPGGTGKTFLISLILFKLWL